MNAVDVTCPTCTETITVPYTVRLDDASWAGEDGNDLHVAVTADYDEGILREHVCAA